MKKGGQLAAKSKANAVQANKKSTAAKAPVMKAKQKVQQARGGKKNINAKLLVPTKNGKKPSSEDDDDESDDDSGADLNASAQNLLEASEESNDVDDGDAEFEGEDDSDSDDDEEDVEVKNGSKIQNDDEEDDDEEEEDDDEEEDEDDEDEDEDSNGPEKPQGKKNLKVKNSNVEESDNEGEDEDNDEGPDEEKIKQDIESEDEAPAKKKFEKKDKTAQPKKEIQSPNRDRKVFVKRLHPSTTEEQLKKHFASCGAIELVKINPGGSRSEAMVVFENVEGSHAALKKNNTVLNDVTILVYHADIVRSKYDPDRTLLIMNVDKLDKLEGAKLEKVFSKCGEIDQLSVVCEKNILAFLTFKNPESVKKAMQLDDTTHNGLNIKLNPYTGKPPKTKIFITNLAKGTTEAELMEMFAVCGTIKKIVLRQNDPRPATAVVTFENQESYCKSFLLHEENLRGQPIYLLPFTDKTKPKFQKKNAKPTFNKGKRPASGNWRNGPSDKKKFKKTN